MKVVHTDEVEIIASLSGDFLVQLDPGVIAHYARHLPFSLHRAILRCRLRPSSDESLWHHHILSISDCHIPAFHVRQSSITIRYSSIEAYVLIQSNSNDPMKTLSYDTFWALWHEYSSILTYRTALPSCSHDP